LRKLFILRNTRQKADHAGPEYDLSNFLFLRGNWIAVDSKTNLIESWTESSDGLFGMRRFSPKFGSAEYDLISFQDDSPQDDLLTVRIATTEGKNTETHVFQLKRAR